MDHPARLRGCLLGTAVGDALLLPSEGLSRRRIARIPEPLRHRLLLGRGLLSDDTEHAFLTAQALLASGGDPDRFGRALAWRLRWWLLGLPAGVGLATARACVRLWLGWSWRRSGVASAGNGPAMRAAVLGAAVADAALRRRMVDVSSSITHRDPRALAAARAVAETAALIRAGAADADVLATWEAAGDHPAWLQAVAVLRAAAAREADLDAVAADLGQPEVVTGYACTSVPLALYAWRRHRDDLPEALAAIHRCGGDVDTIGAICGALSGLEGGVARCPAEWVAGIVDRPLSLAVLERCALALAMGSRPVRWWWPLQPLRGAGVTAVVLVHGFARLARRLVGR